MKLLVPLLASLLANASAAAVLAGFVPSATPKSAFPRGFPSGTSSVTRYRNERPLRDVTPIVRSRERSYSKTAFSLAGQDIIEAGVSFDTFAPQFLWLLIIGLPDSDLTKRVVGSIVPIVGLSVVHLTIVLLAAAQEGALDQVLIFQEVFNPSMSQLGGMQKLFAFPLFCAEEWPHVLIWDLFVGRAIWIDGLERGINTRLALAFCNFIGPPGLLIHVATCLITGKGLPALGYKDEGNK